MIYYKADENKKLVMHTQSASMAEDYHLTDSCNDDDVETAWDGSLYLKGYAPEKPLERQVEELEGKYGMSRWQREAILAEGSLYSSYTKEKAEEIEKLAEELRK